MVCVPNKPDICDQAKPDIGDQAKPVIGDQAKPDIGDQANTFRLLALVGINSPTHIESIAVTTV